MSSEINYNQPIYHGKFCFIPKFELILQEVLKSQKHKGKTGMNISSPDYPLPHWSKNIEIILILI